MRLWKVFRTPSTSVPLSSSVTVRRPHRRGDERRPDRAFVVDGSVVFYSWAGCQRPPFVVCCLLCVVRCLLCVIVYTSVVQRTAFALINSTPVYVLMYGPLGYARSYATLGAMLRPVLNHCSTTLLYCET